MRPFIIPKRKGDFLRQTGFKRRQSREEIAGFGLKETREASVEVKEHHDEWLKSINAESTDLKTLDKYFDAKYSSSPEYQLLMGYKAAVEKGDISPLIGFDLYKQTSEEISAKIAGQTTSNGIEIESFTTHFIDRVLGQTSTPHKGMRLGVPVDDALDALLHPDDIIDEGVFPGGDTRMLFVGKKAAVTISSRDKRLIQTMPH